MVKIRSFDALENYLRNWSSFGDEYCYDLNGLVTLVAACIENLVANVSLDEYEDLAECFNREQSAFLMELCKHLKVDD